MPWILLAAIVGIAIAVSKHKKEEKSVKKEESRPEKLASAVKDVVSEISKKTVKGQVINVTPPKPFRDDLKLLFLTIDDDQKEKLKPLLDFSQKLKLLSISEHKDDEDSEQRQRIHDLRLSLADGTIAQFRAALKNEQLGAFNRLMQV